MKAFELSQGNLPLMSDTLSDENGPVDLTGATVVLILQGAGLTFNPTAVITNATDGTVEYQLIAPQTAVVGSYQGQWQVTDSSGGVRSFPTCPFNFEIIPSLPITPPSGFTRLSDLYGDIRAATGDFSKTLYEDSALASVMKLVLRSGLVKTDGHDCRRQPMCWKVAPDGISLLPAIQDSDVQAYSLLVYNSALKLVTPNMAAYAYRTRAMSERFGEQKDFLFELKNLLYELENEQAYATITGLRSTLFAINGIFVWSYLQAEDNVNLSFH